MKMSGIEPLWANKYFFKDSLGRVNVVVALPLDCDEPGKISFKTGRGKIYTIAESDVLQKIEHHCIFVAQLPLKGKGNKRPYKKHPYAKIDLLGGEF